MAQDIGNILMQGMNQISNTIYNVGIAKAKLKQEKEVFDLQKKKTKAEIDYFKSKGLAGQKELELAEQKTKLIENMLKTKELNLDATENKAKQAKNQLNTFSQGIFEGYKLDRGELFEDVTGIPTEKQYPIERMEKAPEGKKFGYSKRGERVLEDLDSDVVGAIRTMQENNAPVEDIKKGIIELGGNPEDYEHLFEKYGENYRETFKQKINPFD